MTAKSAHRDVALWRFERPSRGYSGFHLRARSPAARARLKDRIAALAPDASHLLRFGEVPQNDLRWPRIEFAEALVTVGERPAQGDAELSLALAPAQRESLLYLLERVAPQEEGSVSVTTARGAEPLWVWWDA